MQSLFGGQADLMKIYALPLAGHMTLASIAHFLTACFHECKIKIKTLGGRDYQLPPKIYFPLLPLVIESLEF